VTVVSAGEIGNIFVEMCSAPVSQNFSLLGFYLGTGICIQKSYFKKWMNFLNRECNYMSRT
jgi:hypothetical protein